MGRRVGAATDCGGSGAGERRREITMKCYTFSPPRDKGNPIPVPMGTGIAVTRRGSGEWIVSLGESGRGRTLTIVEVPAGAIVVPDDGVTPPTGRLSDVPGTDDSVVVRIPDVSGYRGSWSARAPRSPDAQAARDACRAARDHDGWSAPTGCVCPPDGAPSWTVVAAGRRAQGDAGRMGGGDDILARIGRGTGVVVIREGRLYGAPSRLEIRVPSTGEPSTTDIDAEAASAKAVSRW